MALCLLNLGLVYIVLAKDRTSDYSGFYIICLTATNSVVFYYEIIYFRELISSSSIYRCFRSFFFLCPKLVGKSSCYPVQNHVVEWDLCNGGVSIPFLRFHIIIYALNTTEAKFLQELFGSSCCIELTPPTPLKSYISVSFLNTFKYRYFLNLKETLEMCSCDIIRSYKTTPEGTLRSH